MAVKPGKAYSSVLDMIRSEFPDDPDMAGRFLETHKREQIANTLWMMRTHHGLTQAEMAKRLGVSQSAIAKLENRGEAVRFNDVVSYARALGHSTILQFIEGESNIAAMIRLHLEAVAEYMSELSRLSAGDPDIASGAFKHFADETRKMLDTVMPEWTPKFDHPQDREDGRSPRTVPGLRVEVHTIDKKELLAANE